MKIWTHKPWFVWRKWFAWRPVYVREAQGWVWFETIERKRVITTMVNPDGYEYRRRYADEAIQK